MDDTTAICTACDWRLRSNLDERTAQAVAVLHVLARHPRLYSETTGRDVEHAAHEYREMLAHPEIAGVL